MKFEEYMRSEESVVRHCTKRAICPLGALCGTTDTKDGAPLIPHVLDIGAGDLVWTDMRYKQRVFVMQSGVFECITNLDREDEKVFALFGAGYSFGLADLYVDRAVSQSYYFRALVPGRVCSFSGKVVKRRLEELTTSELGKLLSASLLNLSSASFGLTKILLETLLYNRIAQLLVYLHYLLLQGDGGDDALPIKQATIAEILGVDRASTTRALHKLEEDGLIALGYRSISLLEPIYQSVPLDAVRPLFHVP